MHGLGNKLASWIRDARINLQVSLHTYHAFSPCAPCARKSILNLACKWTWIGQFESYSSMYFGQLFCKAWSNMWLENKRLS